MQLLWALGAMAMISGCGGDKDTDSGTTTTGSTTSTTTSTTTGTTTGTTTTTTTAPSTYDLTFMLSGYAPHDGQSLEVSLWDDADASAEVAHVSTLVAGGAVSEVLTDVLVEGHAYTVYWYADLDGDGGCSEPPADHGWALAIATVSGQVDLAEVHNLNFETAVCDFF